MSRFVSSVLVFVILIWNCLFMAACASNGKLFEQNSITEPTYELWEQPSQEDFFTFVSDRLAELYGILGDVSEHVENLWPTMKNAKAVQADPVFAKDYFAIRNWTYGANNFDFAPYEMVSAKAVQEYLEEIRVSLNEMADNLPTWIFEDPRAYELCVKALKGNMAMLYSVATQGEMPEMILGQEVSIEGVGTLKLKGATYQSSINTLHPDSMNYEVKDPENEYLVIEFVFTNTSPEIRIEAVEDTISAIVTYSDGYSYHASMLAEASNRSGISRLFFAESGKTVSVLAVVEVPKAKQMEMALVNLWFAGEQYKIVL